MSLTPAEARAPAPCVLIVDDDRRIVELLEIAYTAHGFRVMTAADGDEAMKCMLAERPDLVVLDVRLPRKSGLEVCQWMRRDAAEPAVPVIMVSAVADTETRLQAFSRGADDYLTKPFSPKELIARSKRLLARTAAAREACARQLESEREAARVREEVQRAHAAAQREQRLRDLLTGRGLELLDTADEDQLAARLLPLLRARLGCAVAGLLLPEADDGPLVPASVRGDALDRLAGLELPRSGDLLTLLAGLDRPVARRDLERFPELGAEVAPLVAAGLALLVPLRGPAGLEGLLVLAERADGLPFPAVELESLASLAPLAGAALCQTRRVRALAERALEGLAERALEGLAERSGAEPQRARDEAVTMVERAARATLLPLRQRRLLAHAIRLGAEGVAGAGATALDRLAAVDPSGLARDIVALFGRAVAPSGAADSGPSPEDSRAAALLAVALAYERERGAGAGVGAALAAALEAAADRLDPLTRQALEAAARETAPAVA